MLSYAASFSRGARSVPSPSPCTSYPRPISPSSHPHLIFRSLIPQSLPPPRHIASLSSRLFPHVQIPRVVTELVAHLRSLKCEEESGIFRLVGDKLDVDSIKAEYNAGAAPDLAKFADVNVHASALKLFLRELVRDGRGGAGLCDVLVCYN